MTEDQLIEKMARAISGSPFPSHRSMAKARAALAAVREAGVLGSVLRNDEAGYVEITVRDAPTVTRVIAPCGVDLLLDWHAKEIVGARIWAAPAMLSVSPLKGDA